VAVWSKELKEILRDSHALTYIIGFPVVFYPMLMWGLVQVAQVRAGHALDESPRLVVVGPGELSQSLIGSPAVTAAGLVSDGTVDARVSLTPQGDRLAVEVRYESTRPRSQRARDLVEGRLPDVERDWLSSLAAKRGVSPPPSEPALITEENVDPPRRMLAYIVSLALPGMLHLVMLLAALYPTVDVVVGERVRGTAETLLVSGAPRAPMVLGKVLAVLSLTIGAVLANAGAMGVTLVHLITLQGGTEGLSLGLSLGALSLAALVCLTATGLVVGMMTLVVTPARSFKQGQGAGNLVVTGGALLVLLGMLPLTPLTPLTALLPLANSVLVLRNALLGELVPGLAWLAAAELLALTWLVTRIAGRRLSRSDTFLG
jgi:sodium transport system permease protein